MTGSAIGQSLLGSGKGVGQSSPFTVGIGPVTVVAGTIRCCVSLAALNDVEARSGVTIIGVGSFRRWESGGGVL